VYDSLVKGSEQILVGYSSLIPKESTIWVEKT
jgi:hypothetical protein